MQQRGGWLPSGTLAGLVAGVVVLLAGLAFTVTRSPTWAAASTLLVAPHTPNNNPDTLASLYDTLSQGQVTATFAELLRGQDVLDAAERADRLSPRERAESAVTVEVVPDTSIIRVTATAPDPALAARVADSVAAEGRSRIEAAPATPYALSVASTAGGTAKRSGAGRGTLLGVSVVAALVAGFAVQQAWAGIARGRRFERALAAEWPEVAPRTQSPAG